MSPSQPFGPQDIIQRLPTELQDIIFSHLTYHSAIRLSQVSRHFHNEIKPETWPIKAKSDLVHAAQYWKRYNLSWTDRRTDFHYTHTLTNGFACYTCLRVLPQDQFSKNQSLRRNPKQCWLRERICLDCGLRTGKYRPGDQVKIVVSSYIRRLTAEHRYWGNPPEFSSHTEKRRLFVCRHCVEWSGFEEFKPLSEVPPEDGWAEWVCFVPPKGSNTSKETWERGCIAVDCEKCGARQEVEADWTKSPDGIEPQRRYKHGEEVRKRMCLFKISCTSVGRRRHRKETKIKKDGKEGDFLERESSGDLLQLLG